jgi:1,4-dihydroxy-2-naphthoate polyprenyltransferase
MTKLKAWIHAFRLRTLPLALSSIILGSLLAYFDNGFSWVVTVLAVVTTLFLQILSNLANDYGDSKHGVDNSERVGPARAVQSGIIQAKEMKKAVLIVSALSFLSGVALIYTGIGKADIDITFLVFLILGISAILAAIKYTIGKNPYGYKGFGDLFVYIFFGLAGVLGTYFLNTHQVSYDILLPASSLGLFSTGVLNLNNMRDRVNDKKSGKNTLVVLLGHEVAQWYHLFLLGSSVIAALIYTTLHYQTMWQFIYLLSFPLFARNLAIVFKSNDPRELDPYLKQLALSTLLFSILFGLGNLL